MQWAPTRSVARPMTWSAVAMAPKTWCNQAATCPCPCPSRVSLGLATGSAQRASNGGYRCDFRDSSLKWLLILGCPLESLKLYDFSEMAWFVMQFRMHISCNSKAYRIEGASSWLDGHVRRMFISPSDICLSLHFNHRHQDYWQILMTDTSRNTTNPI